MEERKIMAMMSILAVLEQCELIARIFAIFELENIVTNSNYSS